MDVQPQLSIANGAFLSLHLPNGADTFTYSHTSYIHRYAMQVSLSLSLTHTYIYIRYAYIHIHITDRKRELFCKCNVHLTLLPIQFIIKLATEKCTHNTYILCVW